MPASLLINPNLPTPSSGKMLNITVNGKPTQIERSMPIDELLRTVEVPPNYLAVELNQEVVPKEDHPKVIVHDGDHIEVVTLVGGG